MSVTQYVDGTVTYFFSFESNDGQFMADIILSTICKAVWDLRDDIMGSGRFTSKRGEMK